MHPFMNLADAPLGTTVTIESIGGRGGFRRRLLELGLLPGTPISLMRIAPLGDPLELLVRGAALSIRRADAAAVEVLPMRRPSIRPAPSSRDLPIGGDSWAGSTP
jgi:ferrous iron transport protein A